MKYYTIMLPQCMDQCSIILYHLVGVVSSISKIQMHIVCLNNSHFQIQNMICINSQLFLYLCPDCNYKSWLVSQKNMKTSYLSAFASGKNQKMQCVDGKYILKKKSLNNLFWSSEEKLLLIFLRRYVSEDGFHFICISLSPHQKAMLVTSLPLT